jgi:hypothetical protein
MAPGDSYKLTKEELELREKIKDSIKESTSSLENFAEAQKTIAKNYKLMQALSLEIAQNEAKILELETKKLPGYEEEVKNLKIINAENQQSLALYQGINKELSKKRNFLKAATNDLMAGAKVVKDFFIPSLSEVFQKFLSLDALAHQTANTLGFQGDKFLVMEKNIGAVQDSYVSMGFDLEDAYKSQTAFSEATGRQAMLSVNAAKAMTETARVTGMSAEEMAGLVGEMDVFGLGAERASDFIYQLSAESSQMGLNSAKVIKSFQSNLGLLNKLNFKNGVNGLKEMTTFSQKFKLDMQSVASVADKVFRPEGAIEAAAQLQVLGGDIAALGDPFQLMYKARNAPEELAKSLTKAATASAVFNAESGEFDVNANELDRLRQMAEATGMEYSNLVEVAKQGAKISRFEGMLGGKGLDSKTMDALVGAANLTKKGGFITIEGQEVELQKLTQTQIDLFKKEKEERDKIAEKAKSIEDNFNQIKNEIMIAVVEVFKGIDWKSILDGLKSIGTTIRDGIRWLRETLGSTGTLLAGLGIYFGAKAAWYFTMANILGGTAGSIIASQMTAAGTTVAAEISAAMAGKGVVGGGIPGGTPPGGTPPAGGQSGGVLSQLSKISVGQILATAVALVAIGAAIWLVADGMSHLVLAFKELNGPQALGAVAGIAVIMGGFVAILAFLPPVISAIGIAGEFAAPGLLAFGFSMLMIGGAIAIASLGFSVLVNSFTNMFKVIGENGSGLLLAGVGFLALAAGIGVLTFSLIAMGAASLLALPGLLILGGVTSMLVNTAESLNNVGGSKGLTETINAINRVDQDKLDALKSLTTWMALLGGTTTIKFDEGLTVGGEITIKGEGSLSGIREDLLTHSGFMSDLKNAIIDKSFAERNGGKAGAYNKFA